MGNPNKAKGDRAEKAVLDYVLEYFPESWRTRAGWDDDRGDVVLDLLGDQTMTVALQVKDTGSVPGTPEFQALGAQVAAGSHWSGVIWHKLRGKSHPKDWRVIMPGAVYIRLLVRIRELEAHLEGVGSDGQGYR